MTQDKTIEKELIDNLLKHYKNPEDLIGENGLLRALKRRTVTTGNPRAIQTIKPW